jgi:heme/copper-type cytochrome/quinol oxidase subunit 3
MERKVMDKRFWLSTAVVFVVSMVLGALLYGGILGEEMRQMTELFRSDEECAKRMPYLLVGQFLLAAAFVWTYRQGRQEKPWLGQGIRYGIAMTLLLVVSQFLMAFAIQPFPGEFIAKQILIGSVITVLLGVIVAWMERK